MNRSTLVAVAVFAALAVAFFATRERQVNVGVQKLELPQLSADAIVDVAFGGATPVTLHSTSGAWTVSAAASPEQRFPADENAVKVLLQSLAELKAGDFVTDRAEKHAELEVDSAKGVTVKASTSAGVVRDLVLGKTSLSGGAYLREAKSNAVFVLQNGLPSVARRNLTAWRRKSILSLKPDEVTRVTITPSPGTSWALQSDAGKWKLEAETPKDYRFDPAIAQRVVTQLAGLSAQDFGTGSLDEPRTSFRLELKSGKALSLNVGAKRPDGTYGVMVDGDPELYLVPAWQAEQAPSDPEALRDLRLLHFEAAQVERLSIVSAGRKTVVTKEGETWKLVEPKSFPEFDPQQVTVQLSRLAALRGQRLVRDVPDTKAGLTRPPVEVELTLKGGPPQRLRFGAELYAKGEDNLLFTMNAPDKTWLSTGVDLFKRPPPSPGFKNGMGVQGLDQLPPEIRQQLEAQLWQQH